MGGLDEVRFVAIRGPLGIHIATQVPSVIYKGSVLGRGAGGGVEGLSLRTIQFEHQPVPLFPRFQITDYATVVR